MLGLHQGQSVLIREKGRKTICTTDEMLDSIKEHGFYTYTASVHGNILVL